MYPRFDDVRDDDRGLFLGGRLPSLFQGTFPHPNPRLYKYYWWVFWDQSPVDGEAFLTKPYRLSASAARELRCELESRGKPHFVYNRRLPRLDPANPFDPQSSRWHGVEWALPYDEDPDPAVRSGDSWHK